MSKEAKKEVFEVFKNQCGVSEDVIDLFMQDDSFYDELNTDIHDMFFDFIQDRIVIDENAFVLSSHKMSPLMNLKIIFKVKNKKFQIDVKYIEPPFVKGEYFINPTLNLNSIEYVPRNTKRKANE